MWPRRAFTMWRSTAWLAKKTPLALTASSRSQSASVTSAVWADLWMPALFTRMSMRPHSARRAVGHRLQVGQAGDVGLERHRPAPALAHLLGGALPGAPVR